MPLGSINPEAIDIVIMGDGYTDAHLGINPPGPNIFIDHADDVADELINNYSPFKEYKNYLNVYRVDVASSADQSIDEHCTSGSCPVNCSTQLSAHNGNDRIVRKEFHIVNVISLNIVKAFLPKNIT